MGGAKDRLLRALFAARSVEGSDGLVGNFLNRVLGGGRLCGFGRVGVCVHKERVSHNSGLRTAVAAVSRFLLFGEVLPVVNGRNVRHIDG